MKKRTILLAALVATLFAAVAIVQGRQRAARAATAESERPAATDASAVAEGPRIVALDPGLAETLCMRREGA